MMDVLKQLYSLEGLRVIVTGASSGLGLNQAVLLANCGATVFALSRSGKPKVEKEEVVPSNVISGVVDVTSEESIRGKINEIGNAGGIDVLVNNAGITMRKRAEEFTTEEWEAIHNVNVTGVFNCCRYAFPFLRKSEHTGRIINISSMPRILDFLKLFRIRPVRRLY